MIRRLGVPIIGALLVTACSAPPEKEHHQAEGAIAAAREAGAGTYSSTELAAAEASLSKYGDAVAERDYRKALSLAVEARDTAYQAARRAADGKAAARSEAERLEADVARLLPIAHSRFSGGARSARLRSLVAEAEIALQEARAATAQGDYRAASARLQPVDRGLRLELGTAAGPSPKTTP